MSARCLALIALLSVPAQFAVLDTCSAQEAQSGEFVGFTPGNEGGTLHLRGRDIPFSSEFGEANSALLFALEEGDEVRYRVGRDGRLASLARPEAGAQRHTEVVTGQYHRVEEIGNRLWLSLDRGNRKIILPREVFSDPTCILHVIEPGTDLSVVVEAGHVREISRAVHVNIDPALLLLIDNSQNGDRVVINGIDHQYLNRNLTAIRARPTNGQGGFEGEALIELQDLRTFENPAAEQRLADGGQNPNGNGNQGPRSTDFRVGDTVGVGQLKGQVVQQTEDGLAVRLWRADGWASVDAAERFTLDEARRDMRRVWLTHQQSQRLEGGTLHMVVNRQRVGSGGGLGFEVAVSHDVEDVILVGIKLRFLLGGLCMEPGAPVETVQEKELQALFANQVVRLRHSPSEDNMDGLVEAVVQQGNVVSLTDPRAKDYLVSAMATTSDLEALGGIFQAGTRNGDEQVLRFILDRAMYPPGEPPLSEDYSRVALRGLEGSAAAVARIVLNDLQVNERDVRRTILGRDRQLKEETLAVLDLRPEPHRRLQLGVLAQLTDCLEGELGQELFDFYFERKELRDATQAVFAAHIERAVQILLAVATSTRATSSQVEQDRATTASKLLEALDEPAARELLREMRTQGLDLRPLERKLNAGDPAASVIADALAELLTQAIARRRLTLDQQVKDASEEITKENWPRALEIIRGVLVEDPAHPDALEKLPGLLLSTAAYFTKEGQNGRAAEIYEEILAELDKKEHPKAKGPLAALYVEAAEAEAEAVVIRRTAHDVGSKLRDAQPGESFVGEDLDNGWVAVTLRDEQVGYVRLKAVKAVGKGRYQAAPATPRDVIKRLLKRTRELSDAYSTRADVLEGRLLADEAEEAYNEGEYQRAIALLKQVRTLAPSDDRMALEKWAYLYAYTTHLMALGAVMLLAIGIGVMQMFRQPKKIARVGDFKHYGKDRNLRERDLDLGDEGPPPEQDEDDGYPDLGEDPEE
jgi:tetratricopeptide (TPR) repeat protein